MNTKQIPGYVVTSFCTLRASREWNVKRHGTTVWKSQMMQTEKERDKDSERQSEWETWLMFVIAIDRQTIYVLWICDKIHVHLFNKSYIA